MVSATENEISDTLADKNSSDKVFVNMADGTPELRILLPEPTLENKHLSATVKKITRQKFDRRGDETRNRQQETTTTNKITDHRV